MGDRNRVLQEAAAQRGRDRDQEDPEPRTFADDRQRLARSRRNRARVREALRLGRTALDIRSRVTGTRSLAQARSELRFHAASRAHRGDAARGGCGARRGGSAARRPRGNGRRSLMGAGRWPSPHAVGSASSLNTVLAGALAGVAHAAPKCCVRGADSGRGGALLLSPRPADARLPAPLTVAVLRSPPVATARLPAPLAVAVLRSLASASARLPSPSARLLWSPPCRHSDASGALGDRHRAGAARVAGRASLQRSHRTIGGDPEIAGRARRCCAEQGARE